MKALGGSFLIGLCLASQTSAEPIQSATKMNGSGAATKMNGSGAATKMNGSGAATKMNGSGAATKMNGSGAATKMNGSGALLTTQTIANQLVGKIGVLRSNAGEPRCTAFCLSKALIATAGHCLRDHPADTQPQHSTLIFEKILQPSIAKNMPTGTVASKISGLVSGGTHVSFQTPIEASHDWAILRLQKPICTHGGFKVSSRTDSKKQDVPHHKLLTTRLVINIQNVTTLTMRICKHHKFNRSKNSTKVSDDFTDPDQLMFHNCDAGPIASGAPILTQTTAGLEVVAMHVGTYVRSRVLEQGSAIVQRVTSKPITNIAVRAEAFTRPIKDLLDTRATSKRTR